MSSAFRARSGLPVIALDCDEVLFSFLEAFLDYWNAKHKTCHKRKEFDSYFFWDALGGTQEDMIRECHNFFETDYFRDARPVEGALEGVKRLKQHYDLVIVTSRPESLRKSTEEWLSRHFPECFTALYFGNHFVPGENDRHRSKKQLCEEAQAIALVDDIPEYIEDAALSPAIRKVVLFNHKGEYGWSSHDTAKCPKAVLCEEWDKVVEELILLAAQC